MTLQYSIYIFTVIDVIARNTFVSVLKSSIAFFACIAYRHVLFWVTVANNAWNNAANALRLPTFGAEKGRRSAK